MGPYSWAEPVKNYAYYFGATSARIKAEWDGTIGIENVLGRLDWMVITKPLPCGDAWIMPRYEYNGASSGFFRYVPIFGFSKWRHPIATGRHDFRCDLIKQVESAGVITVEQAYWLRRKADSQFKKDIALGQTNTFISKFEQIKGYVGVRIGAYGKWLRSFGRSYS